MSRTKDGPFDVSDSTDWLSTPLSSVAPLDSALRCQVCRDFYNTPMITSCSHTFCSLCIRHCLNNDAKCPTCRKGDQESKLRNNYAVEELVEAFRSARPQIMELAKVEAFDSSSSPKRKHAEVEEEGESNPVRKRTRAGRRAQQSSQQEMMLDSEEDEEDYEQGVSKITKVACPMCRDGFPTIQAVEAHLDHCTGEPPSSKHRARSTQTSRKPQLVSKANIKRPDRLAQLNYSMVKDNALRKKLIDLGISALGSRPLMERRYTEWVTLWNANCDSKSPKGKGELKKELDAWERTQGGGAPIASRGNIRDKDFDSSAWSKHNEDSFRELVAQARRKRAVKAQESPTPEAASKLVPPQPMYELPSTSQTRPSAVHHQQRSPEDNQHTVGDNTGDTAPLNVAEMLESEANVISISTPRTSSRRRFFEDAQPIVELPSTTHQTTQILEKDFIGSDMAAFRPLQP